MGVGVGGCWHLPCTEWALLVLWLFLMVGAGVGFLCLEVVGTAGPCYGTVHLLLTILLFAQLSKRTSLLFIKTIQTFKELTLFDYE
jgi:hypothetical protein